MPEPRPLVSIICLCYNQAPYLEACLSSVFGQSYTALEVIVVDDSSTDGSSEKLRELSTRYPVAHFVPLPENLGNCRAFNRGLQLATGKYVVDLAMDDCLLPQRIATQVAQFEQLPTHYGVLYSDAQLIDHQGIVLKKYYSRTPEGQLIKPPPSGSIYHKLVGLGFICTPTMLIRKQVLDELEGYDESLSYEDYDFWVRSGKKWKYYFQDECLTQKRILPHSLGKAFWKVGHNPHLASTLVVCHKASERITTPQETASLVHALRYYLRQCLFTKNRELGVGFFQLLSDLTPTTWQDRLVRRLLSWNLPLHALHALYRQWIAKGR